MIIIISVFKSNNYGSFLQAKALGDILKKHDDVIYLDAGTRSFLSLSFARTLVSNMSKQWSLRKIKYIFDIFYYNFKMWRTLRKLSLKDLKGLGDATAVLGSDEIWNISRKECKNNIFWGEGFSGKKISYAPSINSSKTEDFESFPIKEFLNSLSSISVRDEHSKKTLSSFSNKSIEIVLDPTMLYDVEYYKRFCAYNKPSFKYIALYLFPGKNASYEKLLKELAKKLNCKLLSIGTFLAWCDINITMANCSVPFLYYQDAELVVANTFHGTAFAINFETPFITFAGSPKIKDLLKEFNLEDRNLDSFDLETAIKKVNKAIDFESVHQKKLFLREKSLSFLENAIR